uniref:Extended synaptotagmin-like protein 1a n=1 Tax=Oncorhynchus kisutch TaxID=8019 RepID=A0A8C7J7B3_ONCKI
APPALNDEFDFAMPAVDGSPSMGTGSGAADSALPEEMQPPKPPGQHAVTVLWSFGKFLATLLPVYLAGYFGFSISLVLFGLMVYIGWKHSRNEKVMRLRSAMFVLENERAYTTARAFMSKQELPPWVNFPDVEKVEWMNQILQQAWPFVGQYLEKLLVETITPAIRASNTHLQSLSFTTVNLGEKVLTRVVGVKAHTEHDKRQVLLDLYISYAGDVEINVEIKKYFCKAGVKGIQLHGKLRVILEPLIGDVPLVGAITMFFIRRPKLDINWTGLTNMLDIPGLNAMSDTMIMDAIASYLVLPNRLTIPLVADLHVAQLRSPLPRGVVRIHLLEAEELTAKDTVIKGIIDGKSDPYAVLRVGTQTFTSHTVDSNLNPQWREMFEVIVHEVPGQELEVEVFDKDQNQDDFLGRVKMDLDVVHKARVVDKVSYNYLFCFDQVNHIHIPETLLSVSPCDQVIQRNRNMTCKTGDPPSAAILSVYLDRAQDLPRKKGNKDPSPMVQLSVQNTTKESRICYLTSDPVWEDAFTFYIQDPRKQELDIHVKDDDRALSLGSLSIPLTRLLASPDLSMDQWFQLDKSGRIYINAVLRDASLTSSVSPHLPSPGAGHGDGGTTSEVALGGVGGAPKPEPTRPQQTTPDSDFASEGVLRIHLAEASNLIAKDNFIGGMVKGKSDPYVKIRVAGVTFRSHTIKENLNPSWNELYEIILTQLPGQEIQFELFDKDLDQDDFLGSFPCSLPPPLSPSPSLALPLSLIFSLSLTLSLFPHTLSLCLCLSSSPSLSPSPFCLPPPFSPFPSLFSPLSLPSPFLHISLPSPFLHTLSLPSPFLHTLSLPLSLSPYSFSPPLHISLSPLPFSISLSPLSLSPYSFSPLLHLSLPSPFLQISIPLSISLSHLPFSISLSPLSPYLSPPFSISLPSPFLHISLSPPLLFSIYLSLPSPFLHISLSPLPFSISLSPLISLSFEPFLSLSVISPHSSLDSSDPYVSFILLPDKNRTTKRKTITKKRDLNPEFNERFDFDFTLEECMQRRLDLTVKNNVSFMSRERELIGKVLFVGNSGSSFPVAVLMRASFIIVLDGFCDSTRRNLQSSLNVPD